MPIHEHQIIVVRKLQIPKDKIPTTFVPLSPDKVPFTEKSADLLSGVFHIMWEDMPRRRTYKICLQDLIAVSGDYLGAELVAGLDRICLTHPPEHQNQ